MPYIKQERRLELFEEENWFSPKTPGELNYLITCLCIEYLKNMRKEKGQTKYYDYNQVVGALECAKLEFYRRILSPYEDQSIKENGDVY